MDISASAAHEIACRSRGTPRIANRLLRRVRDYADVKNSGIISEDIAKSALTMLDIDQAGFDYLDRKRLIAVLTTLALGVRPLETPECRRCGLGE